MKRTLAPRPAVPVMPVMISQLTSCAILGCDERRFLELVVPRCRSVAHVGRLRLVAIDEALTALRTLAPAAPNVETAPAAPEPTDGAIDFASADDVLRALGRRRVAR